MLPDRFETSRLILRPIAAGDAPAIFAGYAQDPEVSRYLVWRPHQSLADTRSHIAACLAAAPAAGRTYALLRRADGTLIGAFDLRRPAPHRAEFGYVLARPWWGQGLMTEALAEIAGWALRQDEICGSARSATPQTSPRPGSWRRPASPATACCGAGTSIPIAAPCRATASAMRGCAERGRRETPAKAVVEFVTGDTQFLRTVDDEGRW